MTNETEVKKVDDLTMDVDGKLWTRETIAHTIKTNEDELLQLSERGEHLLNLNAYFEGLLKQADSLGIKTQEEVDKEKEETKEE